MRTELRAFVRGIAAAAVALAAIAAAPVSAELVPGGAPVRVDTSALYPVSWDGVLWTARHSVVARQRPNDNYWLATPDSVFVDDAGKLHLRILQAGGNWYASGIRTVADNYGYGTYRFVVETPMGRLDPMSVVGLFTYNRDVPTTRLENDVELSRWGRSSITARNAQWVVQPWTLAGHLIPFTVPRTKPMTYEFTWKPRSVVFRARVGTSPTGKVINTWKSTAALPGAPAPGTHVNINLWLVRGMPPYSRAEQEVVIRSFDYIPWSG
jgi:hypothetical protein